MLNKSKLKEFKSGRIATIVPAKSIPNSRSAGTGVVTIINSQRNGKRVEIPSKTMERLGNPDFLEFGFADNCMVIGTGGLSDELRMQVKHSGSKGIVYNAGLVQEATEYLNLDFSGKVSNTLYQVQWEEEGDEVFAFISEGSGSAEVLNTEGVEEADAADVDEQLADEA